MKCRGAVVALVAVVLLVLAAPASAGVGLNAYEAKARGAAQLRELKRQGFDIAEGQRRGGIEIVATKRQIAKLRRAGISAKLLRDRRGRTARRAAAAQAAGGWQVWRPYARTDIEMSPAAGNPTVNLMTQLERLANRYRGITKLETIGHTNNGVPIYAMKVTKGARVHKDGKRPAVLYSALQHAREWLAGETERRTLRLFLDNYGRNGTALGTDGQPVEGVSSRELTNLVDTRELWFVLVANPDGYDFTFTPENRLWRKNLRDNDGDGQITAVDGVDLNRNFAYKWGWDNEGSSPDPSSETYRGPAPNSEPETRALDRLFRRVGFEFLVNYHSAAELLLYGVGWQVSTPSPDDQIQIAMAGDDAHPAVPGYDPDISAELYTTNGDTDFHAQARFGTIGFTPEMSTCETISNLDPADQWDPAHPVSVVGRSTADLTVDTFDTSYGSRQQVAVTARRSLRDVTLHYKINGGREQTTGTREWRGGERYGDGVDKYFAELRGTVPKARAKDKVQAWF